ncbi:uncharacterized protein L201_004897 [Kwoniella dendrophila CBS 6074]|uniref:Uncharacterized protein n=1 Tax=Kwoniella dendrophila CBS 6074 TaxID=1295534 RepID=A0AAX4JZL9_9TREE
MLSDLPCAQHPVDIQQRQNHNADEKYMYSFLPNEFDQFSTPSIVRWKRSLHSSQIEIQCGISSLPIPTYPSSNITDNTQRTDLYPPSLLGLSNLPSPVTFPISTIITNNAEEEEEAEDLFEHSSFLSSFPSTRRPSITEYPVSPQLRPITLLDEHVDPYHLEHYVETDVDFIMDIEIDDESEASFGTDTVEIGSEEFSFAQYEHAGSISTHSGREEDVSQWYGSRRSLSLDSSFSSPDLDELIITPFSDISILPRNQIDMIDWEDGYASDLDHQLYSTSTSCSSSQSSSFDSTAYPIQDDCIGLGINFGTNDSPYTQLSRPTTDVSPLIDRGKSTNWSLFTINSLTSEETRIEDPVVIDSTPQLAPSPISYSGSLRRW